MKWKTKNLGPVGYVSPSLVAVEGMHQVVMVTASQGRRGEPGTGGNVAGIDPLTGKVLWEYGNWQCRIPAPSAFDAGDGKVLIIGGYEAGAVMIRIEKEENDYKARELFKTEEFGAHTKPPLLHDGYFYAQYSTNERRDGLVCMSMDGEIMWKTKRDPKFDKGSMILVENLILATDGEKSLYLIQPDPNEFKPIASAELLVAKETDPNDRMAARFGVQNWAPIALADGKLLLRDQSRMMCVKVAE